jgi:Holliday junction DNA helicase RuvA
MIGRIQGTLIANTPPRLIIDCHGVGYEVDVPMSTLYQMPSLGQQVTLLTHFVVREDAQQLFGFLKITCKLIGKCRWKEVSCVAGKI